jgi:hypothetical protein
VQLDNQLAQLVQAMAAYPTTSLGFDPAITAQASNAPNLDISIAAVLHH